MSFEAQEVKARLWFKPDSDASSAMRGRTMKVGSQAGVEEASCRLGLADGQPDTAFSSANLKSTPFLLTQVPAGRLGSKMRIVTWNVNGWKKIRTYQPFFSLQSWASIVSYLEADVVCLQETKLTRKQALLDKEMCVPGEGWESYWDFHPSRGYSGTATYVQSSKVPRPSKLEHGLTGRKVHDATQSIGGYPMDTKDELDGPLFESLDEEGRCVALDFGFFVLFNLYCPVMGSEDRHEFRMAFYAALDERARNLVSSGRNVIIVGDINIARQPIDHCDHWQAASKGEDMSGFYTNPARAWLNRFLQPHGPFHDPQREAFPDRRGMYTCWSTLINARPANYGTRIDYTFVSPGLKEWVKGADIQNETPGSDHCPVFVDLHDERVIDGKIVKLRDLMANSCPSPYAASRWEEFNRKDIKSFFARARAAEAAGKSAMEAFAEAGAEMDPPKKEAKPESSQQLHSPKQTNSQTTNSSTSTAPSPVAKASTQSPKQPRARSPSKVASTPSKDSSHTKGKQLKLGSFFSNPKAGPSEERKRKLSTSPKPSQGSTTLCADSIEGTGEQDSHPQIASAVDDEVDWDLLASIPDIDGQTSRAPLKPTTSSSAWSSLFTAPPAPRCPSHGEEAKSYTVNKKCANTGRKFWLCSRDVGPGYEKGFASSAAGNEGGEYRCGFFKWNSDWEKEWKRKKQKTGPS